jgi:hypothetical protein
LTTLYHSAAFEKEWLLFCSKQLIELQKNPGMVAIPQVWLKAGTYPSGEIPLMRLRIV